VAALISLYGFWLLDPLIYSDPQGYNLWFESDAPRVLGAMTDPDSKYHARNEVHPIFSLLGYPLFSLLEAAGLSTLESGAALMAVSAFVAAVFLYLALRGLGLPRAVGTLFTGVFLTSAAFIHWFCIIETFAPGSAAICFTLFLLTTVSKNRWWLWGIASVATLGITTTNWMAWLTAAFFRLDFRKFILIGAASALVVVALSLAQQSIFPESRLFFVPRSIVKEVKWTMNTYTRDWRPDRNVRAALVSSAVAPAPIEGMHVQNDIASPIVDNQSSSWTAYTTPGFVAVACWLALFGTGIVGGIRDTRRRAVFFGAGAFVAGQLALHLIYGEVTFLYVAHFFPAMVLIAAFSWFSPARLLAVVAAAIFIVAGGWANLIAFEEAAQMANTLVVGRK